MRLIVSDMSRPDPPLMTFSGDRNAVTVEPREVEGFGPSET